MTLREYLRSLPTGGQAEFAKRIGVVAPYLSQLSGGFRQPGIEVAALIERESGGMVRAEEMLPDVDWTVIRGKPPDAEPAKASA